MLILDKRNDIKIFKSFGVTEGQIKGVFFNKSILTILTGIFIGVSLGLLLALLQQKYGLISMGSGSFVVDSYPVIIKTSDFFVVSITVFIIGMASSWYPAKILSQKLY